MAAALRAASLITPYANCVTSPDVSSPFPDLHNTIVVAAFEGWNDAGDAASDALEHLDAIWEADPIVEIDDEAYYDYQVNRPVIRQVDGVTRELSEWALKNRLGDDGQVLPLTAARP